MISAILVVVGFIYPEKVDEASKEIIVTASNEIMTYTGVLVGLLTGWFAKDPVVNLTITK